MDIAWIGHAAFRLRGRDAAVVMDPCAPASGFRLGRPQADIVTVSAAGAEHGWVEGIAGEFRLLDAPGEYEIQNVLITGVATPAAGGAGNGQRNVAFVVTLDDVTVAHLGDPAEPLPQAAMEELSRAHVLLVPVGGHGHLAARAAAKIVAAVEPRLVIPMLYAVAPEREELDPLDAFLREMGATLPAALENHINLAAGSLPETTAVLVLTPRGE